MTKKIKFILESAVEEIKSTFIDKGWITIFRNIDEGDYDQGIFCCIVYDEILDEYKNKTDWVISFGSEGKPCIISRYDDGTEISEYQTFSDKGIEPFIFKKNFKFEDKSESYIDISEEFILYFKLYEQGLSKQNRKYFFIDELHELEEVINISEDTVKIKLRYLREYLSIRKVNFAICFDFMYCISKSLEEVGVAEKNIDYQEANYIYNHLIRPLTFSRENRSQSWIYGKSIIEYEEIFEEGYLYDYNPKYEEYITGYDDKGNIKHESCKKTNKNGITLTYFKKEVLDKYYNQPKKYTVDGFRVSSDYFSLKIDNNIEDYVPIFLNELSSLPNKEQIYWKHYNIEPQEPKMSQPYFKCMIEGEFPDPPQAVDLYFKYKYADFNKKWESKFGWKLYKELSEQDNFRMKSLHLPSTNNIKTFCEQVFTISIVTVERLNEKKLKEKINDPQFEGRGISKFEKYLQINNFNIPDLIIYLRNLHDLRSGLLAHSFSNSNKKVKKAMEYFEIEDANYRKVAKQIFINSVNTFNTLESIFKLNEE